ncbi:MAG: branched-chain amino acid ABC transporter permease [Acidobacteriota bacterium]
MALGSQLLANILYSAATIFLVGISFSLAFSTARFFHFAHAAVITTAGYVSLACSQWVGLSALPSVVLALAASTGLGWSLDKVVYRPLRRDGATPLVLLLASLGLYTVLQSVISIAFGDDTKVIAGHGVASSYSFLGARVTSIQVAVMGAAVAVLFVKIFLVDKMRIGLALRAVADSPELARVSGIDCDKIIGIAFCLGSFLGGATGLFRAFDVGMTPIMGLPMLLQGVVAVVVGGNGRTIGVAVASLLLAFLEELAGWNLGTHWEEAAAFLLLLAFLLLRPQGILGKRLRKSSA